MLHRGTAARKMDTLPHLGTELSALSADWPPPHKYLEGIFYSFKTGHIFVTRG